jgi:hypothetical protein
MKNALAWFGRSVAAALILGASPSFSADIIAEWNTGAARI